jgi:hypothetical protein
MNLLPNPEIWGINDVVLGYSMKYNRGVMWELSLRKASADKGTGIFSLDPEGAIHPN